jgi:hypothetical protein
MNGLTVVYIGVMQQQPCRTVAAGFVTALLAPTTLLADVAVSCHCCWRWVNGAAGKHSHRRVPCWPVTGLTLHITYGERLLSVVELDICGTTKVRYVPACPSRQHSLVVSTGGRTRSAADAGLVETAVQELTSLRTRYCILTYAQQLASGVYSQCIAPTNTSKQFLVARTAATAVDKDAAPWCC